MAILRGYPQLLKRCPIGVGTGPKSLLNWDPKVLAICFIQTPINRCVKAAIEFPVLKINFRIFTNRIMLPKTFRKSFQSFRNFGHLFYTLRDRLKDYG
jgi:hypothetical protein